MAIKSLQKTFMQNIFKLNCYVILQYGLLLYILLLLLLPISPYTFTVILYNGLSQEYCSQTVGFPCVYLLHTSIMYSAN